MNRPRSRAGTASSGASGESGVDSEDAPTPKTKMKLKRRKKREEEQKKTAIREIIGFFVRCVYFVCDTITGYDANPPPKDAPTSQLKKKIGHGLAHMATDEDIGKLFHELDTEDLGYITLDQMVVVGELLFPSDLAQSSRPTEKSQSGVKYDTDTARGYAEKIMAIADFDGSGQVDRTEFISAIKFAMPLVNERNVALGTDYVRGVSAESLTTYLRQEVMADDACQSLPLTISTVFFFWMLIVWHINNEEIYGIARVLEETMVLEQVTRSRRTGAAWKDFYAWAERYFFPRVFPGATEAPVPGRAAVYNQLLGGVRLTQKRRIPGECRDALEGLAGPFVSPFPPREDLLAHYGALEVDVDQDLHVETLCRSEEVVTDRVWFPAQHDAADAVERLMHIQDTQWLGLFTESVTVDVPAYNGQLGVFAHSQLTVHFDASGAVVSEYHSNAWMAAPYTSRGMALLSIDGLFVLNVMVLVALEIREIRHAARMYFQVRHNPKAGEQGHSLLSAWGVFLPEYFTVWNILDWMIVSGCVYTAAFFYRLIILNDVLAAKLFETPVIWAGGDVRMSYEVFLQEIGTMGWAAEPYFEKLDNILASLEEVGEDWEAMRRFGTYFTLAVVLRFIRSWNANNRLHAYGVTIVEAFPDIFHYLFIFAVLFLLFTFEAHVIYGPYDEMCSYLSTTLHFVMLLAFEHQPATEMNLYWLSAAAWIWFFKSFIVLLSFSILTAILVKVYMGVSASYETWPTMWEQLWIRRQKSRAWRDSNALVPKEEQQKKAPPLRDILMMVLRERWAHDEVVTIEMLMKAAKLRRPAAREIVVNSAYLDKKNIVHAVSVGYPELCHLVGRVNRYVEDARKQEIRAVSIQKRNLAVAMPREAAEIERKQAKRLRKMLDDLLRICKKHEKKMIEDQTSGRLPWSPEFAQTHQPKKPQRPRLPPVVTSEGRIIVPSKIAPRKQVKYH